MVTKILRTGNLVEQAGLLFRKFVYPGYGAAWNMFQIN
jgi:hypothetical protein